MIIEWMNKWKVQQMLNISAKSNTFWLWYKRCNVPNILVCFISGATAQQGSKMVENKPDLSRNKAVSYCDVKKI